MGRLKALSPFRAEREREREVGGQFQRGGGHKTGGCYGFVHSKEQMERACRVQWGSHALTGGGWKDD